MAKFYFYKTISEKGKLHVIPIEGQGLDEKRVQCPTAIRDMFPAGTIFVGDSAVLDSKGTFYRTKNFRRLVDTMKEEMAEYADLLAKMPAAKIEKVVDTTISHTILDTIISDSKLKAPSSKDDGFYMSTEDWNLIVRNIKKHVNTMIIGPTGSGKTSCIKEVCDRMGLDLHIFDMGSMIDPISSLLGVHRLEAGGSVFDYAKFTQVIQTPCVILLDELSRAPLSAMNVLFSCLDDRRSLSVEIAGGKDIREIKVHPEVTFIATANVGAEYSGTNSMDRALVNRFFPLELGIIPAGEEEKVLMKRTGINSNVSKLIVKVANNIRGLSNKQEISTSLSIRETLMVAGLVSDGWGLGKAMEMIYLPLYEGSKTEGERSTVYKTISSY